MLKVGTLPSVPPFCNEMHCVYFEIKGFCFFKGHNFLIQEILSYSMELQEATEFTVCISFNVLL